MDIKEQENTYSAFMAWTKYSLIAVIAILVGLAVFVA